MRIVNLLLVGCVVVLAFAIYQIKHETHERDQRVAALRLDIRKERDAIAILRAEWSHLNRPKRIERLARRHLGLQPMQTRQMITLEHLAKIQSKTPGTAPAASRPQPFAQRPDAGLRHAVKAVQH